MGLSINRYPYTGGSQVFPVNFALGFLNREDVQVYVEGELDGEGGIVFRDFTWQHDGEVTVTDDIPNDTVVVVQRTVSKENLVVDFNLEGSATRRNIQFGLQQAMMAMHEFIDGRVEPLETIYPFSSYITEITDIYQSALQQTGVVDGHRQAAEASRLAAHASELAVEVSRLAAESASNEAGTRAAEAVAKSLEAAASAVSANNSSVQAAQSATLSQESRDAAQEHANQAATHALAAAFSKNEAETARDETISAINAFSSGSGGTALSGLTPESVKGLYDSNDTLFHTDFNTEGDTGFNGAGSVGPFTDFASIAHRRISTVFNGSDINTSENGALRSAMTIHMTDRDSADYRPTGRQAVSYALRVQNNGLWSGTNFTEQTKDIIGFSTRAEGATTGERALNEGISAFLAVFQQWGRGIGTNELVGGQPEDATGHASRIAPAQIVLRNWFAPSDGTHQSWGALISNDQGHRATAGLEIFSAPHGTNSSRNGEFLSAIRLANANVAGSAIQMPRSGNGAGLIDYGPTSFTNFVDPVNRFDWVADGTPLMSVNKDGLSIGSFAGSGAASLILPSGTPDRAQLLLPNSFTPDALIDGQVWRNGPSIFLHDVSTGTTVRFDGTPV